MKPISIGELSRRAAVKVPTIRFYEERGLLPAPGRTEGNRRTYGEADVRRLQAGAERSTNDRIAQLGRQLKTESDENARLKKLLADAQAKLDAIANIERSANDRQKQPEGRKP